VEIQKERDALRPYARNVLRRSGVNGLDASQKEDGWLWRVTQRYAVTPNNGP
jgi:hypothetical protein